MKESYYERSLKKRELRKKQVRRNKAILLLSVSILLVIIICLSCNSISTKASDPDNRTLFTYYKSLQIQQGDTLWSIAKEYKTEDMTIKEYVNEVKRLNSLDSDRITFGSYIFVPYYSYEFVSSSN